MHEESAIILAGAELLIGRQGSDVVEDVFVVHFSLLALIRPGELPLGLAPRIPQPQQSHRLLARLVVAVWELNDIVDGVCVVEDKSTRLALDL